VYKRQIYNIFAAQSHFSTYGNQNLSPIPPAFLSIDNKIFVLMLVVSPFLWLPFLSKRFIFLLLPYLYILFLANSWVYEFPYFLFSQYGALIIPFLYLGTIDALSKFPDKYQIDIKPKNFLKKIKIVFTNPKVKLTLIILIVFILLASVYEPFGPINEYTRGGYNSLINTNTTKFNELENIIKLIPPNDPWVMTQNDIPEIYPRPNIGWGFVLDNELYPNNFTLRNHWVYIAQLGWVNTKIDYVIANPLLPGYWATRETMYNITSLFYGSGEYGILAEASGFVLLERNYTGPIVYYVPINEYYPASQFHTYSAAKMANGYIYVKNSNSNSVSKVIHQYGSYLLQSYFKTGE